jgi:uncharacterized protein (DUF924 family)
MAIVDAAEVLTFWLAPGRPQQWYAEDAHFDADIRRRFLATYEAACSRQLDHWRGTSQSLLALIIVLDQFPRNMFRGSARAFASDAQAVTLTKQGIEKGFDRSFSAAERDFFYMPLMHSESLSDQALLRDMATIATHANTMKPSRASAASRVATPHSVAKTPPKRMLICRGAKLHNTRSFRFRNIGVNEQIGAKLRQFRQQARR